MTATPRDSRAAGPVLSNHEIARTAMHGGVFWGTTFAVLAIRRVASGTWGFAPVPGAAWVTVAILAGLLAGFLLALKIDKAGSSSTWSVAFVGRSLLAASVPPAGVMMAMIAAPHGFGAIPLFLPWIFGCATTSVLGVWLIRLGRSAEQRR